jgi:predicted phosphodiesterase
MKIALCSDLHLEFSDINIQNTENADVLILSGDIMVAQDLHKHPAVHPMDPTNIPNLTYMQSRAHRFRDFLRRCSFEFPHVIYIAGNHEFYHGYWEKSLQYLRDECGVFSNIYFLEKETKVIDDVTFIGSTLWTDCNKMNPLTMNYLEGAMNDYRLILNDTRSYSKLRTINSINRHIESVTYIRYKLAENKDNKVVVVGHHAPTHQSIHPMYVRDREMNGGYASDLSELILDNPQIVLWTHGHMHHPVDYMVGPTRIVCNPRGYAGHDPNADIFAVQFLDI